MSPAIHDASARQKSGEPSSPIGQAANRQNAVNAEALLRLPELDLGELRQQWRGLYKTQPPPNLSRELLVRAVAYRMQEVARGGLRSEPTAAAPRNCTAVQGNRKSYDTRSPGAEARNPAGAAMAGSNV
jgi:hypothetical protein